MSYRSQKWTFQVFINCILLGSILLTYQGCGQISALKPGDESSSFTNPEEPPPSTPPPPEEPPKVYPLNPVPVGAQIQTIASGHTFNEGPAYHRASNSLYFGDLNFQTPAMDSVFVIDLNTNVESLWKGDAGGSNGNMFDANGTLYTMEGRSRRLVRHNDLNNSADITQLPNTFDGHTLNAPNDLDIHTDGSIYFTDPTYGTDPTDPNPLPFRGVFRMDPQGNLTAVIYQGFSQPNGIVFSPDFQKLYVSDSEADTVQVFDVQSDGSVNNGQLFYTPAQATPPGDGNIDGITIDDAGNLYLSGAEKITIVNPTGTVVAELPVGERTTNCTFGGLDNKTLFITGGTTIRKVDLLIPGRSN